MGEGWGNTRALPLNKEGGVPRLISAGTIKTVLPEKVSVHSCVCFVVVIAGLSFAPDFTGSHCILGFWDLYPGIAPRHMLDRSGSLVSNQAPPRVICD